MTIKEQLKQYRTMKLELEEVSSKIDEKCIKDSAAGSMKDFPWILQNHSLSGIADEDYNLLERKLELKTQIKAVDDFVREIEDNEIRTIILMRYVSGKRKMSWQNIALKLGYCAEHTPKRKLQKYFCDVGNVGKSMI